MADLLLNCPHCQQPVTCNDQWAGQELQCPGCHQNFVCPGQVAAPPPPPSKPSPFKQHAGGPAGRAPAQGTRAPVRPAAKQDGAKKWLKVGAVVIVLGVGGYFGTIQVLKWQKGFNEKSDQAAKNSDGGEVGHIANVYGALDATDVDKHMDEASSRSASQEAQFRSRYGVSSKGAAAPATDAPEKKLPILPAVWTLDLAAAKIPEGRANGTISGTNFVYETARLDATATAVVLSLRQGTNASPDGEILVYLHPKRGEKIGGSTWAIDKDMKGSAVPQVAKRWKPNPKFAATTKSFPAGYAMKLELGGITNSQLTGKIFVALPDPEQSVVAGIFSANTSLPDTTEGGETLLPAAVPVATPARPTTLDPRYRTQPTPNRSPR